MKDGLKYKEMKYKDLNIIDIHIFISFIWDTISNNLSTLRNGFSWLELLMHSFCLETS